MAAAAAMPARRIVPMGVGDGTGARLSSRVGCRRVSGVFGLVPPPVPARALHSVDMVRRDPHEVLGVDARATPTQIKAAWRRLARTNHPDLTGDDPAASRLATRRMAEINDAYAALTRNADRPTRNKAAGRDDTPFEPGVAHRRGDPPAPKPTRPVTGRVDMSGVYQPRNQAVGNGAGR